MRYKGEFLYPPRPVRAVAPGMHRAFLYLNYRVQTKKNGSCAVIHVGDDGKLKQFWTRRGEERHAPDYVHAAVDAMRDARNSVVVGEVIGKKVKGSPNCLYVFDLLVHKGEYLYGRSSVDRLKLISESILGAREKILLPQPIEIVGKTVVQDQTQVISRSDNRLRMVTSFKFTRALRPMERLVYHDEDEGVVFKDLSAPLEPCTSPSANQTWMVKTRFPRANYSF